MKSDGLRPIPAPYLLTLGLAITSLPNLGIGLGAILLDRAGHDPFDSWGAIGMTCFVAMFGIGFAMRLIFWRRSSPALASGVRKALTAIMILLLIATVITVVVAVTPDSTPGWAMIFVGYAVLAQVPNVIWLVRYRNVMGT